MSVRVHNTCARAFSMSFCYAENKHGSKLNIKNIKKNKRERERERPGWIEEAQLCHNDQ